MLLGCCAGFAIAGIGNWAHCWHWQLNSLLALAIAGIGNWTHCRHWQFDSLLALAIWLIADIGN